MMIKKVQELPEESIIKYFSIGYDLVGMSFSVSYNVNVDESCRISFWKAFEVDCSSLTSGGNVIVSSIKENGVYEVQSNWENEFNRKRKKIQDGFDEDNVDWLSDFDWHKPVLGLKHFIVLFSNKLCVNILATGFSYAENPGLNVHDSLYNKLR